MTKRERRALLLYAEWWSGRKPHLKAWRQWNSRSWWLKLATDNFISGTGRPYSRIPATTLDDFGAVAESMAYDGRAGGKWKR